MQNSQLGQSRLRQEKQQKQRQKNADLSVSPQKEDNKIESNQKSIGQQSQLKQFNSVKNEKDEDRKREKINQLMIQNKRLRISNKQLKKQLEIFEKRLDETLKKRTVSEKKPRVNRQVIENMELKNAYKQCQIYKRQIANLKKKQAMFDEQRIQNLTNQVSQFEIQREKLLQEIKGLKRITKQQQKGLVQLTGMNFSKFIKEYEQMKEQNKKLHQRNAKQDRQAMQSKLQASNQRRKNRQTQMKSMQLKKKQEQRQASQLQLLKTKTDKDSKKIVFLVSQNNKLNTYCEQLKQKIQEKDKQINALRLRLGVLRKQARTKRLQTQPSDLLAQNGSSTLRKTNSKRHLKQKSEASQSMFQTQIPQSQQFSGKKTMGRYPKLVEAGDKKQGSFKWNHHQFSSKIKQIQVIAHPNGHINQLNFRYEKGEPNLNSANSKNIFNKFTCQENTGEFIKKIKGGFKDGLLLYISGQTNKGRPFNFCQFDKQAQCVNFVFGEDQNQFPGAFFGENSSQGINRIGCLVQCLK